MLSKLLIKKTIAESHFTLGKVKHELSETRMSLEIIDNTARILTGLNGEHIVDLQVDVVRVLISSAVPLVVYYSRRD